MKYKTCSIARLKDYFDYDPEAGTILWARHKGTKYKGDIAGCLNKKGYRTIKLDGMLYLAHRMAWAMHYGAWPEKEIDHINHIKNDNRIENLREVDATQQSRNKGLFKNNRSGYHGVVWNKRIKKWQVQICVDNRVYYYGSEKNLEDAVKKRKALEKRFNFHDNHGVNNV